MRILPTQDPITLNHLKELLKTRPEEIRYKYYVSTEGHFLLTGD